MGVWGWKGERRGCCGVTHQHLHKATGSFSEVMEWKQCQLWVFTFVTMQKLRSCVQKSKTGLRLICIFSVLLSTLCKHRGAITDTSLRYLCSAHTPPGPAPVRNCPCIPIQPHTAGDLSVGQWPRWAGMALCDPAVSVPAQGSVLCVASKIL